MDVTVISEVILRSKVNAGTSNAMPMLKVNIVASSAKLMLKVNVMQNSSLFNNDYTSHVLTKGMTHLGPEFKHGHCTLPTQHDKSLWVYSFCCWHHHGTMGSPWVVH